MNKAEMVDRLAARDRPEQGRPQGTRSTACSRRIGEALANGRGGAGSRASGRSLPRPGRPAPAANPQTGEAISISASKSPSFKAGKALRDAVNADRRS